MFLLLKNAESQPKGFNDPLHLVHCVIPDVSDARHTHQQLECSARYAAICMGELLELDDGGFKGLWGFRRRKSRIATSEDSVEYDRKAPATETMDV